MMIFKGIEDIFYPSHLKMLTEGELEFILVGHGSISVKDWQANTEYKNCDSKDKVVVWFWRAVMSFSETRRAKLLSFVTVTSRVPITGFAVCSISLNTIHIPILNQNIQDLQGSQGPKKFMIEKFGAPDSLPRAHTCFNRLDLPEYISYDQLRDKVITAIEGACGFDGVD